MRSATSPAARARARARRSRLLVEQLEHRLTVSDTLGAGRAILACAAAAALVRPAQSASSPQTSRFTDTANLRLVAGTGTPPRPSPGGSRMAAISAGGPQAQAAPPPAPGGAAAATTLDQLFALPWDPGPSAGGAAGRASRWLPPTGPAGSPGPAPAPAPQMAAPAVPPRAHLVPAPETAPAAAAGLQATASEAGLSALAGLPGPSRVPDHQGAAAAAVPGSAGRSGAGTDGNPLLAHYLDLVGSARTPAAAAMHPNPVVTAPAATMPRASGRMHSLATPTLSARDKRRGDPLYVLDLSTGETIPANVTLNTFSTWGENVLAQVAGATVSSYSWDVSRAPDLTNVSGTATANLQGTWASFTGAARTDTITITETAVGGGQLSQTITFRVAGTNSPAYSSTRPTTSATWSSALTPDQLTAQQAVVAAGPYAGLGLADGSVQTAFAMPTYNPAPRPPDITHPPS
jgi:hypothetical protein